MRCSQSSYEKGVSLFGVRLWRAIIKKKDIMNNILEDVEIIAFRGQLYEGERKQMTPDDDFIFGDAECFSSHYAEGSTYAKASITINPDLTGNIDRISKANDIPYSEVRESYLSGGDGKVITSLLTPKRMMVFGMDGKQFFDISDEQLFRQRFDLAMLEIDVPREERERMSNFVVKFNHDPQKVMSALTQNKQTQVLRQFASVCNCDAFKTHPSITPHSTVLRSAGMRNEHFMILDKSKVHNLRVDGDPITMDERLFQSPHIPWDAISDNAVDVLDACREVESEIRKSVEFSVNLISEVGKNKPVDPQQPPEQAKRSAPTVTQKVKVGR